MSPKIAVRPRPSSLFRNLNDAAEYLNADPRTIRKLIDAGKLRAIRVGHEWRIRETWIEEFIDKQSRR